VLVGPGEEVRLVREGDLAVAGADHDPRPVGVMLGDGVAIIGHERMFASRSSQDFAFPRRSRAGLGFGRANRRQVCAVQPSVALRQARGELEATRMRPVQPVPVSSPSASWHPLVS
jgi:hypothetical protein